MLQRLVKVEENVSGMLITSLVQPEDWEETAPGSILKGGV